MIFVVLGTQKFQLNRLLKVIDELIIAGEIQESVFAQIGYSDYRPQNYEYVDFLPKKQFDIMVEGCDLLIAHGGVGTIIKALNDQKPIIVYPRLAKYKEHVDNHQIEIAQSFKELNYVLECGENDNLADVIKKCRSHIFSSYQSQRQTILETIYKFIEKNKNEVMD